MTKVSNYIARKLADSGVQHVFMLTGGGAMHLNDSFGHEPRIQCVCNHHEQACAMAAEAYAKLRGRLSAVNVTSGPGGLNAINGVFGAWTDSVPVLILSGQVKRETCLGTTRHHPGLRQLGEQEANIVPMISGITKYASLVDDPLRIRYHLEKAVCLAQTARQGPCWLDIPVDVQGAFVNEDELIPYDETDASETHDLPMIREMCREVARRMRRAARPVVLAGSGIRRAGAEAEFERVIRKLGVPTVPSRSAHDLVTSDDPLMAGRPGIDCDRAGNFTIQNSDLLLVLGSRLSIRLVGYEWTAFARNAYKIQVDIDPAELDKPTVRPDQPICCDLKVFLREFERVLEDGGGVDGSHTEWLRWCRERVERYPCVLPRHRTFRGRINPYHFFEVLFDLLAPDECIVSANGAAYQIPLQAGRLRKGQRWIFNNGCMSMGYALPAAIGAAFARPGQRIVCLDGDGSVHLNVQELQTIVHHRLPVKVFVINNEGYLSIRITQTNFFGRLTGEGPGSGVSFPSMARLAEAYGVPAVSIDGPSFQTDLMRFLSTPGPALAEVMVDPAQVFEPKVSAKVLPDGRVKSVPPEDMFPFLDRQELADNMNPPDSQR